MADITVAELQGLVPNTADVSFKTDQTVQQQSDSAVIEETKSIRSVDVVRQTQKDAEAQQESMSEKQRDALKEAFTDLNMVMDSFSKSIRFAVFEQSGDLYAQVINTTNNEVVKTIPSEEALSMMSRIHDVLGMLVDKEG